MIVRSHGGPFWARLLRLLDAADALGKRTMK